MTALDHTTTSTHTSQDDAEGVDAVVSTTGGAFGSPMVAALEGAWAASQQRHPQVPAAAVIVVGPGSGGESGLKLGHFAAMRWQHADAAREGIGPLPEVFVRRRRPGPRAGRGAGDPVA